MKLEEAVRCVNDRSMAAVAGPDGRMTASGAGNVAVGVVEMLLAGVAAPSDELMQIAAKAADSVMAAVQSGEPPRETVAGAIVESILLGALVGMVDP